MDDDNLGVVETSSSDEAALNIGDDDRFVNGGVVNCGAVYRGK